jgi:hypothetical protein
MQPFIAFSTLSMYEGVLEAQPPHPVFYFMSLEKAVNNLIRLSCKGFG